MCPPRTEPPPWALAMIISRWSCSGPHSPEAAGKSVFWSTSAACWEAARLTHRHSMPPNIGSIQEMPQSSKLKVNKHRPMSPRSLLTGIESKTKASVCVHRPEPSVDRGSISSSLTTETKHEAESEVLAISKHLKWYGKVTSRKSLSLTSRAATLWRT